MAPKKKLPKRTAKKSKSSSRETWLSPLQGHDDLPATVGLVKEVRAELVSEIRSVRADLSGQIQELRGEFTQLGGEVKQLEGKFEQLRGEFEHVTSGLHRVQAIVEEQRSENRIVLDGLKTVLVRQDRNDGEIQEIRQMIKAIAVATSPRVM